MRYFLIVIFSLLFVVQTQAQFTTKSSARKSKAFGTTSYSEDFTVKVKANAFSVEFERYDPYLDDDLKEKIKNFFKSPPYAYSKLNTYKLRIVKKNDTYYVLEGNSGINETLHPLSKE